MHNLNLKTGLGMISSKDKPIRVSPTVFYSLDKDVLGQVLTDLESMYVCISINELSFTLSWGS